MNTNIKEEHKVLAEKLAADIKNKWLNDELDSIGAQYEAVEDALAELSLAMAGQYAMEAFAKVVALFDEVMDAVGGVCGTVDGTLWKNVLDEDGEVEEYEPVATWAEADWAELRAEEVSYRASLKLTRYESFAGDVAAMVERCMVADAWSDADSERDGDVEWFRYIK